jgi:hypothetical protein
MRVLTNGDLKSTGAEHIFLLHNGLNETRDIGFHYRLANWLLSNCDNSACILRPLPAHLTRYPFQGSFAERPLDEFLLDPASLFRQFLRYMQETQWLLSVLAPRANYEVVTGCDLLLPGADPGREDAAGLAIEIAKQANRMLQASGEVGGHSRMPIDAGVVEETITSLRDLLGWQAIPDGIPSPDRPDTPAIHAVGYSMGGFVAQSVFCTWPFVVASCSNLFAGGALRDLAPTAFAHQEEWQSLLHGLRFELDQARIEGYFDASSSKDGSYVVGMEKSVFDYFDRIFVDVFVQADRGSYSSRLAEFSRRLLFILGGDDPIVRTRNVLDAAPPGGITMHQIGDMTHFPGNSRSVQAEMEQREFWLPEVVGMISRFARRAADLLQQSNNKWWDGRADVATDEKLDPPGTARLLNRALPNVLFEQELDRTVSMLDGPDGGWLFIARNQIPTVFLDDAAFRVHAAAMHHSEDLIGLYVNSLAARAKRLEGKEDRVSLLVPEGVVGSVDQRNDRARFSKSEVAFRYFPDGGMGPGKEGQFASGWAAGGVVRLVKADEYLPQELGSIGPLWAEKRNGGARRIAITMLPDAWIAFSRTACRQLLGVQPELGRDHIEGRMVELACDLVRYPKVEEGIENKAKMLRTLRASGDIRVITVSAAELNPRYRGRLLDDPDDDAAYAVQNLLVYWAMVFRASSVHEAPNSRGHTA